MGFTPDSANLYSDEHSAFLDHIHPEDRRAFETAFDQAISEGAPYSVEYRFTPPNGVERHLHEMAEVECDPDGKPLRAFFIAQDVSARYQAAEAMRESAARYRGIFDNTPISIWEEDWSAAKPIIDKLRDDGVTDFESYFADHPDVVLEFYNTIEVLDVNQTTAEIYNAPDMDALLEASAEFDRFDDLEAFAGMLAAVACGDAHVPFLCREKTFDGREIVMRNIVHILPEGRNDWSRVIVTVEDDTAQVNAEQALRESEARYREIFNESPSAIWEEDWSAIKARLDEIAATGVTDWAGYLQDHRTLLRELYDLGMEKEISQAALDIFGWPSRDVAERATAADWANPSEIESLRNTVLAFLDGRFAYECDIWTDAADGRHILVNCRIVIPAAHQDTWSRVLYVIEDVTDNRQADGALRESEARYREIFRDSPAAIMEEDWSAIKRRIDEIVATEVADWPGYFEANRDVLIELFRLGRTLEISQAAVDIYGLGSADELPTSIDEEDWRDDNELDGFRDVLIAFLAGSWNFELEILGRHEDGHALQVLHRVNVPHTNRHDWSRVLYSLEDVTEQRQAETSLRASEAKYREIFNESPSAIWIEDWSPVKRRLSEIATGGVTDFAAYFEVHPDAVVECFELAEIVEIS